MEIEFTNIANEKIVLPLLIDFPFEELKKHLWFLTFKMFNNDNSQTFKYQPNFIQILVKYKNILYPVEKIVEYLQTDKKKKQVNIENKLKDTDNSIWVDGKKISKGSQKIIKTIYKPDYLVDFLDKHDIDINKTSFYFLSIVDHLKKKQETFANVKKYWIDLTEKEYTTVVNFISSKAIPSNYDAVIYLYKNDYNIFKNIYNELNDEYNRFKEFNEKNPSFILDVSNHITNIDLSKGDEGNKYIDLYKIFKLFPTSDDNPFLAIRHNSQNKIKLDTGFHNTELIEKWSVNKPIEKKDLGIFAELINPKGLLIKIRTEDDYINLHIFEDGKINVRFQNPYKLELFKNSYGFKQVKKSIDIINKELTESFYNFPSKLTINCFSVNYMNSDIDVKYHVNQTDLSKITRENVLISHLYLSELMNTIETESDSIKLITKTIKEGEKKSGIFKGDRYFNFEIYDDSVITIRRNTRYDDASLVNVNNLNSLNKLEIVKKYINFIWYLLTVYTDRESSSEFDKKVNKNKELKQLNKDFNPRDCQKEKQPTISNTLKPLSGSYELNFKGNRLICENPEYPYPGFTVNGNVCCFKKDQRKTEKFKNNSQTQNNFLVQPSNITYKREGKSYPMVLNGQKLFYIKDKKLFPATESKTNEMLEKERKLENKTYFLPPVQFHKVITIPARNSENLIKDSKGNLSCPEGMFFGFNRQGAPFCFVSPPEKIFEKKTRISMANHIIKSDKILPSDRLGNIPDKFKFLFVDNEDNTFYRVGVAQNNESFVNAISRSMGEDKWRKIIAAITYSTFITLENGDLAPMFNFLVKDYIKFLKDQKEYKDYSHVWDIAEIALRVNIIILDNDNSTFICHERPKNLDLTKECIFLLKTKQNYEPIMSLNQDGYVQPIILSESDLIYQAYNYLCKPEERIPNNIRFQILDNQDKSKIKFFVLESGLFYPVSNKMGPIRKTNFTIKPKKIYDTVPIASINKKKPIAEKMYNLALEEGLKIKEQIAEENKDGKLYTIGLITEKDEVIPTRKSELVTNLQIAKNFVYFPEADKKFKNKPKKDKRVEFIENKQKFEVNYHEIKYDLSQYIKTNKLRLKDPKTYINIFFDTYENNAFLTQNRGYIFSRLSFDMTKDPLIVEGNVPKKYKEEYNPDNQIIITEINRLKEYIETIKE